MSEQIVFAATSLVAIAIVALAMLRGWQGWLTLKEHELERSAPSAPNPEPEESLGDGRERIEIADLKHRIRKLEAIASGVDL